MRGEVNTGKGIGESMCKRLSKLPFSYVHKAVGFFLPKFLREKILGPELGASLKITLRYFTLISR